MIKLEHTDVYGWEAAIRGMRNPMNSWDKTDSNWCPEECCGTEDCDRWYDRDEDTCSCVCDYIVGENDLKLMKNLSKAGNDHGKFLRMINVTVDITAPLYWWKEFDTYKVGTVANSCSTMHKIHAKEFELDDFSTEHLVGSSLCYMNDLMRELNGWRSRYLTLKNKEDWWQMIQLLPSSYNQKRTVQLNYQVLKSMYFARRHHKLDEWHDLCAWCEKLPYFKEICIDA